MCFKWSDDTHANFFKHSSAFKGSSVGYLEIEIDLETSLVIGNLWSRSCSWSRSFWSWNFLSRSARDQHCYYIKCHTKKLLKSFTNRRKRDSMERIHPRDTHGLHTSIFISFFNFRLGPGVYTAALEKCTCTLIVGQKIEQPKSN